MLWKTDRRLIPGSEYFDCHLNLSWAYVRNIRRISGMSDGWSFPKEICIIYDQWCISQCTEIISKQWNKIAAKKQVYLACCILQSRLKQNNEWNNERILYQHIGTFMSLVGNFVQSSMRTATILTKQKDRKHKGMEKKTVVHRNKIDVTMNRILKTCRLLYYRYIMAWYLHEAVSSPIQFFAWPLFLLLLLPLPLLLLVAAAAAPVVLAFVAAMFPIDCFFYLAFSLRHFPPHLFEHTSVAWNGVYCCRFFQTILPVNYLIKWNGCFKYWIKSKIQ